MATDAATSNTTTNKTVNPANTPTATHARSTRGVTIAFAAFLLTPTFAPNLATAEPLIQQTWTDKAQYQPGQPIIVSILLSNTTGQDWTGAVAVKPRFLGHQLGLDQQTSLALRIDRQRLLTFTIEPDSPTDRGYLIEIECIDQTGQTSDSATTAFDFAQDWTTFPRYGFLTQFNADTVAAEMLDPLRNYKINAIQYYDWMDEHHIPYRTGHDFWQDIAARDPWVSKAKLNELIHLGHQYNISAMAYDLMNGAYANYADNSDVELAWGTFTNPLGDDPYTLADQDRHDVNVSAWETPYLYLFNPDSQDWRNWIAQRFQEVYANIDFDGWHIDTLGDRGRLYEFDGSTIDLANTFTNFVNDMRTQLGTTKYLTVNTVSNYGLSCVAQYADTDIIYSELWTGLTEDEFYDLKLILDLIRAYTDKPAVIAGYINADTADSYTPESPGQFNEPSILLADAAIFANGGWHIELGDGLCMLSDPYFPHQALVMSETTKAKLLDYYNFAVAYENLLRDNVSAGYKRIDFDPNGVTPTSYTGDAGTVWKLSKYRPGMGCATYYDITHLINLTGSANAIWRDPTSTSTVPQTGTNKPVRIYYNDPWQGSRIWYASPDQDNGQAHEVADYTLAFDSQESQWYAEFTLPTLQYWTMIWIERQPQATGDDNCDGRIDLTDFAAFTNCITGPASTPAYTQPPQPCLAVFDTDADNDIDLTDFANFQTNFTTP